MHRISTRVALAGGLLALVAALVVVLSAVVGGSSGALASGSTPTNTPGPTPTPKSTDHTGEVDGVYDIVVDGGVPATDLFHCIALIAHDGTTDAIKAAVQCHDNTGAAGVGAASEPINSAPGEGPTGDSGAVGPPPPPPYNGTVPSKGYGTYDTGTDDLTLTACIPEVAGPLGPNIIATLTVDSATADLSGSGAMTAAVVISGNRTDADCEAHAPAGGTPIAATLYPAFDDTRCPADPPGPDTNRCVQSPFRAGAGLHGSPDWDQDGCTDTQELDKNDGSNCGDDPWNPNDTSLASTDVSGDYTLVATAVDEDCNPALSGAPTTCEMPGDRVPGLYYSCIANIAQSGKALTARLSCYIDSPIFVVNPQAAIPANSTACPPASAQYCGDGSPGAPPPGNTVGTYPTNARLFGDVDSAQPQFTGTVDNPKNAIVIAGCFPDLDGFSALGNTYARATADMHTGHGWAQIYANQTMGDCTGGTPVGTPGYVPVDLVRQAQQVADPFPAPGASTGRDSDGDGCSNRRELTDTANRGGLRDPANHYDYFNPTQDGLNRVDDILATVNNYFVDDPPGNPDMKSLTDRVAILGGNAWNLGAPNGQQRVDDILNSVKQYFHDC